MGFNEELSQNVNEILRQTWTVRAGNVVPTTDNINLTGGAVKLTATMLYADLADSTDLAMNFDKRIAAKVFKSFLLCSSKIIRKNGGHIRSFDGDRVMGVFIGNLKNSSAVKTALMINHAFLYIIKPKLEANYSKLKTNYNLAHCVGVDTSEVLVVRSGIRDNNDLVWIGRAPNIAAKLSGERDSPYNTYITDTVYNSLTDQTKFSNGVNMWLKFSHYRINNVPIYRSKFRWKF